jgi:2,4-dienoyl-CoA reductase-like NADH-dependent reductase (Old Yellow Enzyme family)
MPSALFSPIKLAGLTIPNRIVVSPMCQYSANDGVGNDWHMTHLGMLANSGAGLLVLEATHVERHGRITHGCLGIYSDDCEDALRRIVLHCKRIGTAKMGIQLAHAGRKASSQRPWEGAKALGPKEDPWPTIAPSALPFGPGWHTPRAMNEEDMARVRDEFVDAAKRAVRVGFDAVELHLAHGYLLHSFVSPLSNKRNDDYGGSLAGRMRYPLEVAHAVRAALPAGMPLGARITGTDWLDGGLTGDDAAEFAKALKQVGLDYVDISSGNITYESRAPSDAGYNVPIAEKVRRESGIAVRVVGMIESPKQAEAIIADGKADMVALARGFLDDPHWGWHAAQTLGADVARPVQYARSAPALWPGAALRG